MHDADYTSGAGLSTAQHTPGPWAIETDRIGQHTVWNDAHFCVAMVVNCRDETDANAALIAAAPDLLALLERISVYAWRPDAPPFGLIHEVDAAIAKARGVSP